MKARVLSTAALVLLAALAAGRARAQSAAGADAFDFLRLDAGARAVGLGGAYTALASDSAALIYNPAGLGRVSASEASFMHNQYAQGVTQQWIGAALKNGWGAQFSYASLGDVPRTTISNPSGTGVRLNVSESALGGGYGQEVTPELALGGGLKYVQESLGDATANGWALDGGGLYKVPDVRGLTVGASLLNVGPAVKFDSRSEKLPTTLRLGSAYQTALPRADLTFALDLAKGLREKVRLAVGGEALMDKTYAVRLGYTSANDAGAGVSLGLGWRGPRLGADYAFVPMGELGTAHRLSFTLRWGAVDDPARAQSPAKGTAEAYLALAQEAIARRDYPEGKRRLGQGLALLPKGDRRRVRFQERLGSILVLEKDFRGAVQAYAEGVNQAYADGYSDESVADSYVGIGMCFAAGKNWPKAELAFRKGLALGPSPKALELANAQLRAIKNEPAAE